MSAHPHQDQNVYSAGAALETAKVAAILLHGRGADAADILQLTGEIELDPFVAYLAPEAVGNSWFPVSFRDPIEQNEPWLGSALQLLGDTVEHIEQQGVPAEKIVLGGFSQGACLSLEYVARNPRRYGGVLAFAGGLFGPDDDLREYEGGLDGTPVFLGCSDNDPHVPLERVQHSTAVFEKLGAQVTERIYPEIGHVVNDDEIEFARGLLLGLATAVN